MGKIALEEHVVLDREDHIDRWRTLVPMIPEQFQQRIIPQLTDTSRRLELMDQGEIDLAVLSNGGTVQGFLEPRAALRMAREANDHLAEVVRARPASLSGRPELIGATWSWTAETATHALRIVFGGVFDRFPRVRLILGHMGETLPFFLWRLDQRAAAFADHAPEVRPSGLVRRNIRVTTAGSFSDEPLRCALDALGEDNVMYSVDYPFESMTEAAGWLDAAKLDAHVRAKVERENAQALLKLNQPGTAAPGAAQSR